MKNLLIILISTFSLTCLASVGPEQVKPERFLNCSGYHFGSYLNFFSFANSNHQFVIEASDDGDPEPGQDWPMFQVTKFTKARTAVAPDLYKQTLLDAVQAMNDESSKNHQSVFIEADSKDGQKLYVNLDNWTGDSFMVWNGFVEPITCEILND